MRQLSLCVVLVLAGCGGPQQYHDADTGCSFSYPSTWTLRERAAGSNEFAATADSAVIIEPAGTTDGPRITVMKYKVADRSPNATAETFLDLICGTAVGKVGVVANPLESCAVPHYGISAVDGTDRRVRYVFAFLGEKHLGIVLVAYGADLEDRDVAGVIASIAQR